MPVQPASLEVLELMGDITALRTQLLGDNAALRGEVGNKLHRMESSITRQMYAAIMGQFALLPGVAYFFVSHVQR
jgi:hypothetical protein